ncbi:ADP-ribosylation factor GTPase-activating protein 3 [Trichinella spiralis]|uniref:ADP-ribosylation factor GTPase-activating protein 3 n=1 Tax=Trichinella spiralis TaxID=6334 RepID=UPI0001EFEE24|nr:ADP-ribosylation factor GTPase-activating protein 3 [Trichinella spiralis]
MENKATISESLAVRLFHTAKYYASTQLKKHLFIIINLDRSGLNCTNRTGHAHSGDALLIGKLPHLRTTSQRPEALTSHQILGNFARHCHSANRGPERCFAQNCFSSSF